MVLTLLAGAVPVPAQVQYGSLLPPGLKVTMAHPESGAFTDANAEARAAASLARAAFVLRGNISPLHHVSVVCCRL